MGERVSVVLVCTKCGARNFRTTRSRRPGTKVLEFKKYCPGCNAHTVHKESK